MRKIEIRNNKMNAMGATARNVQVASVPIIAQFDPSWSANLVLQVLDTSQAARTDDQTACNIPDMPQPRRSTAWSLKADASPAMFLKKNAAPAPYPAMHTIGGALGSPPSIVCM